MSSKLAVGWQIRKLTEGTVDGQFHAHSYYDIPVFDADSRRIAAYQMTFAGRHPTPDDIVTIGWCDVEAGGFEPVGESRAWSVQQGPMAQWTRDGCLVWNDRDGGAFVARIFDVEHATKRTLPFPVYALDPHGRYALSLNMARLDHVRPGYGYTGGEGGRLDERRPNEDGIWRVDLDSGAGTLVLSLDRAVSFLMSRLSLRQRLKHGIERYIYWFNHVKISPDGRRFTVKLRFRSRNFGKGWNDQLGVSLTCNVDGEDLRYLSDGTSHVIWLDNERIYFWQRDRVRLFHDTAPDGSMIRELAPALMTSNVHLRHIPNDPDLFVFDTPYRRTVDLFLWRDSSGESAQIATFDGHVPERSPFRCDLHPVPSLDGQRIVVTSLTDGGRQLYLLERINRAS